MAKVRINFDDFLEMLDDCEYGYHFESSTTVDGELVLNLFVDGNPSGFKISIRSTRVEVITEMEL